MPRKKKLPELPPIPSKRYFPIREASALCGVKDYVLRFWEKEFSQLRPMKRGSQRAYRAKDILIAKTAVRGPARLYIRYFKERGRYNADKTAGGRSA